MKLVILLAAFACALTSALAQFPGTGTLNTQNAVTYSVFRTGSFSNADGQQMVVIDNESDLARYWKRMFGQDPQSAPLGINWAQERLIAFHIGKRQTGGFSAFVQRVEKGPDNVARITVVERFPIAGQYVSQVASSPFVIIRIQRGLAGYVPNWQQQNGMGGFTILAGGGGKCNCSHCSCGCGCGG